MFFNEGTKSNLTCALKVDTNSKGWSETTSKILRKIKGLNYNLDTKDGMIYISGKVDPHKILRMITKHAKKVELCWMKTVEQQYGNGNNYGMDQHMPISGYTASYHNNRGYYTHPPPTMSYSHSAPHQNHCYIPQLSYNSYWM